MTSGKQQIRQHRGPILIETGMLFQGLGIVAADQVLPKTKRETPPEGLTKITKAGALRMLEAGTLLTAGTIDGAMVLRVSR